jgi:DNA-binding transcriptional ArsR family regulator
MKKQNSKNQSKSNLKNNQQFIHQELTQLLKTLSSPVRIKIITLLSQGPLSVEVMAKKMNQTTANTSMHLRKMFHEGLVESHHQGPLRIYQLHPSLQTFWPHFISFAKELDPRFKLQGEDDLNSPFHEKEILKLVKEHKIVFIDTRPLNEVTPFVREGKILQMIQLIQLPFEQDTVKKWNHQFKKLKIHKNKIILLFGRGPLCVLCALACEELRALGYEAYRLTETFFQVQDLLKPKIKSSPSSAKYNLSKEKTHG